MLSVLLEDSKACRFYTIPKIHKPGNPGKPNVSSCGAAIEMDLTPLVTMTPSYVNNTPDFILQKLATVAGIVQRLATKVGNP